jgi:hypothetical protein
VGITEGPGEYLWGYTVSPNQTGFTGWSIEEDPLISFNQAGIWEADNFSSPISAFQFSVASAAVSEPSSPVPVPGTYALLASSLAVLAAVKRRRRISA